MKSRLAVAAAVGVALAGALASPAGAQCGTGVLIDFDANCFAYESSISNANRVSGPGSSLTVVGIVTLFCAPLNALNPNDPSKEYTFIWDGLTSAGTVINVVGSTTFYDTDYSGGMFRIYEGSPRNAPTAAGGMPPSPPNATVPANFTDGTLVLQGTLSGFHTTITQTGTRSPNGSYRSNYQFIAGGTMYSAVSSYGPGLMQGLWCVTTGCTPTGYSAHPDGKWDVPQTTAAQPSSWGSIKQLYR